MKNIAVLVSELTVNYNFSVLEGIERFFSSKDDVRFFVSTVCQPSKTEIDYQFQYWTAMDILKSMDIDAVIIITNSFMNTMKLKDLTEELKIFAGKPIFSIATPLKLDNTYYTHTVCTTAYDEVVQHMVEKHEKKHIAFFSAGLIDAPDSDDRLEAYKAALVNNGLEYDPSLVYKGDFTPGTAHKVMNDLFKKKEDIPFDAILCANDYTAGGVLLGFLDLGITAPDDISVFGFDDDPFAILTKPTLSSISQEIEGSGAKAAEMAWRYLNGEQVDETAIIQSQPVYRQSCGCITTDMDTSAYIDCNGLYHPMDERMGKQTYKLLSDKLDQTRAVNSLIDVMNTRIPFSEFVEKNMGLILYVTKITDLFICMYDTPIHCEKYSDFCLPEEARLILYANNRDGVQYSSLEKNCIKFNPRNHLFTEEFGNPPAGKYFLQPMFMHETNYGFLYCRLNTEDNTVVSVNLKLLTNVVIQSIEFQRDQDQKKQLISSNQTLNLQSKTDELTQILNRRGFFDNGQKLIDLAVMTGKSGVVFFCDLDGLKTINDTYGHDIGDLAIKTEAQVLKTLFRDSDMVGRLSGDEFGIVAPGMQTQFIPALRTRLDALNEKFSKEAGLPFTLSISMGPVDFNLDNADLQELLALADDNLYIEKKKKHGEKK